MFASLRRSHLANDGFEGGEGLDHIRPAASSDFDFEDDDEDATDVSQRYFPYDAAPLGGGAIRMEGWLNHTTSIQKNNAPAAAAAAAAAAATGGNVAATHPSMLSKTVSKKSRQSSMKKQPRYFVLRGSTLSYYARRHDVKAKGTFVLTRGCSVGPVVFGSLDNPGEVAAGGVGGMGGSDPHPPADKEKSKKKRRKFYCVQLTWSIKNKPSKAEEFIAQAKAQVAAESENEAMQQQQQQLAGSQTGTPLLDDGGGEVYGGRSPMLLRKQLGRRAKSESAVHAGGLTPPRHPAASADDDHRDDDRDGGVHVGHGQSHPPSFPLSTPATRRNISKGLSHPSAISHESHADPLCEAGPQKHYKHQIEKHTRDQQKSAEESQKVKELLSRREMYQRTRKRMIQGTKVAALGTAAVTTGLLTAGAVPAIVLALGITATVGGSGAVVGSKVFDRAQKKYSEHQSQKSFHLLIGAATFEEATRWKLAMEYVIKELANESDEGSVEKEWSVNRCLSYGEQDWGDNGDGTYAANLLSHRFFAPSAPTKDAIVNGATENATYHDTTPKWVPIQGGGMALWGILGALGGGGGNLRIYREEHSSGSPYNPYPAYSSPWLFSQPPTSAFPTIPKLGLGLSGQPFPPFKASVALKSTSLDAFMCLMCSGRIHNDEEFNGIRNGAGGQIPLPNSGQIASFRVVETIDDHMDVINLVFRPLYLFPSWTAPRDFVLYRFWKYDDDGTYQICLDSGEHRDCPRIQGYVRGEMHSVYTIAPLKWKKKRGTTDGGSIGATTSSASSNLSGRPNLMNEECLLSLVVQIDPKGWVPSTSSIPFFRSQGYGDAFAIMALHQMLDVKETLDAIRFVAVPMDSTHNTSYYGQREWKHSTRLLANGKASSGDFHRANTRQVRNVAGGGVARGLAGNGQRQQPFLPTMEACFSGDASEEDAEYDIKYSGVHELCSADQYRQLPPIANNDVDVRVGGTRKSERVDANMITTPDLSSISTIPPPTIINWWAEPEASSFRVRGKTYKSDNTKVNAGSSLFRLFAADIVETDIPIMTGMCSHPKERVQLAIKRDREALSKNGGTASASEMPAYIFVVNIAMPGPPHYHMVFYYAVDNLSAIDGSDGTPSSKLCKEFFFGNDDTFRDNTFKLIPQIIEGNFMVRKAVGSTPAIMGNKIKQTYFQGDRFFELMIDTGSSAVAAGVIRICNGYARTLIVDLAFLFEGNNEETLPERVLGTVRLKNVEFGKKLRFVESFDE